MSYIMNRSITAIVNYIQSNSSYTVYPKALWAIGKDNIEANLKTIEEDIIIIVDDYENKLKNPKDKIILRTSLCKSLTQKNEYPMPFVWRNYNYVEPLTVKMSTVNELQKPKIGFCGSIKPYKYRKKFLELMEKDERLDCDFIKKPKYNGTLTDEFVNCIQNNHFTFCNRGAGNFSMRFYEVLSCGRIPILINTNLILPFNNVIDWDDIIIMGNTYTEMIDKLITVWENEDIVERQKRCYDVFQQYFTKKGFAKIILTSLQDK